MLSTDLVGKMCGQKSPIYSQMLTIPSLKNFTIAKTSMYTGGLTSHLISFTKLINLTKTLSTQTAKIRM